MFHSDVRTIQKMNGDHLAIEYLDGTQNPPLTE